jgi:hypothetical protein
MTLTHHASVTLILTPMAPDDPRAPPARVVTGFPIVIMAAPGR